MRKMTLAISLALMYTSGASAQHGVGMVKDVGKECGCTMMTDTAIIWLRLTREQIWKMELSDARCLNACAKSSLNPFGNADAKAAAKHDKELKRILTDAQYKEWVSIRNVDRSMINGAPPGPQ